MVEILVWRYVVSTILWLIAAFLVGLDVGIFIEWKDTSPP